MLFTLTIVTACSSWKHDFQEFQQQVKQRVNPQELQDWATPIIQGHNAKYRLHAESTAIQLNDLPSSLKSIGPTGPEMAFLSESNGSDKTAIYVAWGGGFGHWGLVIGEKDFTLSNDNVKTVVRWVDGIYFFKQTK
jgi:hypothetical protein